MEAARVMIEYGISGNIDAMNPSFDVPELLAAWQPVFPMHRMAKPEALTGLLSDFAVNRRVIPAAATGALTGLYG